MPPLMYLYAREWHALKSLSQEECKALKHFRVGSTHSIVVLRNRIQTHAEDKVTDSFNDGSNLTCLDFPLSVLLVLGLFIKYVFCSTTY